jgi:hypothetical protein
VWAGEALHAFEGWFVELQFEVEGFGDGLVGYVIVAVMVLAVMLIVPGNGIMLWDRAESPGPCDIQFRGEQASSKTREREY